MSKYPVAKINKRILAIGDKFDMFDQTVQNMNFCKQKRCSIYELVQTNTGTTNYNVDTKLLSKHSNYRLDSTLQTSLSRIPYTNISHLFGEVL